MIERNSATSPLEPVDVSRRKVVKVALAASAVAVPVISSVALGGVSPAFAESPNISGQTTTPRPKPVETTTATPSSPDTSTTMAPETTMTTTTTTTSSPATTTTTTTTIPPETSATASNATPEI